jgi:hypothetical protein
MFIACLLSPSADAARYIWMVWPIARNFAYR